MTKRHLLPVWLMGLTNLTYGLYGGVVASAVPQLPGLRHVPEAQIAGLTELAFTPCFCAILFETIGQNNPFAASTFCFISSACGVPIWVHDQGGCLRLRSRRHLR